MQVITKDVNEMLLLNLNFGFQPILNKAPIPVNFSGYEFALLLVATKNVLVDNVAERILLTSSAPNSVFQIQNNDGRVFINFPMKMLHSNYYTARLYLQNSQLQLLMFEFQLVKSGVSHV